VLLREVQASPLQGHRLRALRRGGDAFQGAARAHGSHRPGRSGVPHLVLQGRPEPDRLPAGHRAQGAREGPVLRRFDRHLDRRGGARQGPRQAREGGRQGPRHLRGREGGAHAGAARVARPAPGAPQVRQADRLQRRGPSVGRFARGQHQEALRQRPREAREGSPQGIRPGHLRHRGVHRGCRGADAPGLGEVPGHDGQGGHPRRGSVP
jgi:hypothetical protein